ncbi:MAG TPA: DUF2075 domain-containing protein, partial [Clostridiaceae bacterium]|nr:DUF2075 domain-containing protein [Clostridiaceae bacterium]
FEDLQTGNSSMSVVQGGPGTGKTIVAIYLLKLLRDIQLATTDPDPDEDGRFSDFFFSGYREALQDLSIGLVVPQQSLRKTIHNEFRRTPGLNKVRVLSPYTVANSEEDWDILVVDEAHRLTQRGSGMTIGQFRQRNQKLFGEDAAGKTAIDWVRAKSKHQIFLVDGDQTVRPADVPVHVIQTLKHTAQNDGRLYSLESQMRVTAGDGYLNFARALLTNRPLTPVVPDTYDLKFFSDLAAMREAISQREQEVGLSRMVAGYAWPWKSKGDSSDEAPYDIEVDGVQLRWNRTDTDWIASASSPQEVGSVHTVQGYDLNYAGVIIGPDIIWDEESQSIKAVKANHFDTEVKRVKDENDLLEYIVNSYYVLLTRGMLGTYIYVYDEALRKRLEKLFVSRVYS